MSASLHRVWFPQTQSVFGVGMVFAKGICRRSVLAASVIAFSALPDLPHADARQIQESHATETWVICRTVQDCLPDSNKIKPQEDLGDLKDKEDEDWTKTPAQISQVQRALKEFGFDIGSVDGIIGRKTKSGIGEYQAIAGYPVTETLGTVQKRALLRAYELLVSGTHKAEFPGLIDNQGDRSLLRATADPEYYATHGHLSVRVPGEGTTPSDTADQQDSLRTYCETVRLRMIRYGGPMHRERLIDREQAVDEIFCNSISHLSDPSTFDIRWTPEAQSEHEITCSQFADSVQPIFDTLGSDDVDTALSRTRYLYSRLETDNPMRARQSGRICLRLGYAIDDPKMALGGALLMASHGQRLAAEFVAHHMRTGMGTAANPTCAKDWFVIALKASLVRDALGLRHVRGPARDDLLRRSLFPNGIDRWTSGTTLDWHSFPFRSVPRRKIPWCDG